MGRMMGEEFEELVPDSVIKHVRSGSGECGKKNLCRSAREYDVLLRIPFLTAARTSARSWSPPKMLFLPPRSALVLASDSIDRGRSNAISCFVAPVPTPMSGRTGGPLPTASRWASTVTIETCGAGAAIRDVSVGAL